MPADGQIITALCAAIAALVAGIGTLVKFLLNEMARRTIDADKRAELAEKREDEVLDAIVKILDQINPTLAGLAEGQKDIVRWVTQQQILAQIQRGGPP